MVVSIDDLITDVSFKRVLGRIQDLMLLSLLSQHVSSL